MKFTDNTAGVGLISINDESVHRQEVEELTDCNRWLNLLKE